MEKVSMKKTQKPRKFLTIQKFKKSKKRKNQETN